MHSFTHTQIADPQTADYDKRTPLHLSSAEGHLSVVQWLLNEGADPNSIDRFKRTPLEVSLFANVWVSVLIELAPARSRLHALFPYIVYTTGSNLKN